ncbi:MAG TPA: hypothetical protein VFI65_25025 [Streptosporangiaceae bacterium]|nr:hypothetical protein [Streptosporangiaceae bacterium]
MEGEYCLKRHVGHLHFARVRVVAAPAESPQVQVSPGACLWLAESYGSGAATDVPEDFKASAESGARLALAQIGEPFAVTVTKIGFTYADTTPDDVAAATFHAVMEAVGRTPVNPPYVDADGVHFPL